MLRHYDSDNFFAIGDDIGDDGVKVLAEVLKVNKSLTELNIYEQVHDAYFVLIINLLQATKLVLKG